MTYNIMFIVSQANAPVYISTIDTYDYSNIFASGDMFTTDDRFTTCPLKEAWYKPQIQYSLFFCTFIFNNPLIILYGSKLSHDYADRYIHTKFRLPIYSWALSFLMPLIITLIVGGYYDLKGLYWSLFMYCFLMTFSTLFFVKKLNNNKIGYGNEPVDMKITDFINEIFFNVNFFEKDNNFDRFIVASQMVLIYLLLPFGWSILLSSDYQNILNSNRTILAVFFIIFLTLYCVTVGLYEFNYIKAEALS